jgi:hypothetical protein
MHEIIALKGTREISLTLHHRVFLCDSQISLIFQVIYHRFTMERFIIHTLHPNTITAVKADRM